LGGVQLFGTVGRVGRSPPVVGPSTWLPERDLIAVITRRAVTRDDPAPFYDLTVRGRLLSRWGSLNMAREAAEFEIGEPLRWEQVAPDRHEAWSHRLP
jgi:hypothetical protein